jgi:hypothetical protein
MTEGLVILWDASDAVNESSRKLTNRRRARQSCPCHPPPPPTSRRRRRTTRISRSRPGSARRACGPPSPRSTGSRAPPTTSPTKGRRSGPAAARPARLRRRPGGHRAGATDLWPLARSVRPAGPGDARLRAARSAAGRPALGLRAGRREDARRQPAMPTAPNCWTTAAARPTRSAGCCCISMPSTMRSRWRSSDAICSALQLINFWQDIGVDLPRGRFYLPLADCAAHRLAPEDVRPVLATPRRPKRSRWSGRTCAPGPAP